MESTPLNSAHDPVRRLLVAISTSFALLLGGCAPKATSPLATATPPRIDPATAAASASAEPSPQLDPTGLWRDKSRFLDGTLQIMRIDGQLYLERRFFSDGSRRRDLVSATPMANGIKIRLTSFGPEADYYVINANGNLLTFSYDDRLLSVSFGML
jgi:hypothetical protein